MSLLHVNFFSQILELSTSIYVVLPDPKIDEKRLPIVNDRKYPVLYLLHGLSDDHTIWQRRTSIERYASEYELAVVMPEVGRSFYTDMDKGLPYWTYLTEELPRLIQTWFPISSAREDTFAAGLSMGGYGAFKLGLTFPDRYAAVASLSGAVDMADIVTYREPPHYREMRNIFGKLNQFKNGPHDLFALAEELSKSEFASLPLFQWCGKDDFLYASNLRFHDLAVSLGLNLTYGEGPGGHVWQVWDDTIQQVLAWLPLTSKSTTLVAPRHVDSAEEPDIKPAKKKKKKKGK